MMLVDEAATQALGAALALVVRVGDVIALSGPLGSGKTTLVRALLRALGEEGEVPSPSFALVQPYDQLSPPVWHADLYRLDDPAELLELGLDEILTEGALIVEWPERAPGAWPEALALSFEPVGEDARRLTATAPPPWKGRWPPRA
ncbi:MAG: tRNA (adenosine(37)-N6)-threonylcarbamoyltransferase complex ATPase subunit type 1 TsaE [Sphingomicrobium sp.]